MAKHDPNAPKEVKKYLYFNNVEYDFEKLNRTVLDFVTDFENTYQEAGYLHNGGQHTWRGETYWWPERMTFFNEKIVETKGYFIDHYRWWQDRMVEEAGYALYNYLYDMGRKVLPAEKKKSLEQVADEYATTKVNAFKELFV